MRTLSTVAPSSVPHRSQLGDPSPARAFVDPFEDREAPRHLSLADQIEQIGHAMTAEELASLLGVARVTIFKQAKAKRIPCFHVGTCVRFDPHCVAKWLRTQ